MFFPRPTWKDQDLNLEASTCKTSVTEHRARAQPTDYMPAADPLFLLSSTKLLIYMKTHDVMLSNGFASAPLGSTDTFVGGQ